MMNKLNKKLKQFSFKFYLFIENFSVISLEFFDNTKKKTFSVLISHHICNLKEKKLGQYTHHHKPF